MPVHPVLRPDGQPLEVPAANQGLPSGRLGEAAVVTDRFDHARKLGRRRDVADEHTAGCQCAGHGR